MLPPPLGRSPRPPQWSMPEKTIHTSILKKNTQKIGKNWANFEKFWTDGHGHTNTHTHEPFVMSFKLCIAESKRSIYPYHTTIGGGGGGAGGTECATSFFYWGGCLLPSSVKKNSHNKFTFLILWKTRKLRSLLQLKDKVDSKHCCNVVYEGTCSCGTNYISITIRNTSLRFDEHHNPKKNSEPAKHIKRNEGHVFTWKIVCKTPKHKSKGRILEAFLIKLKNPSLNNQLDSFQLKLFQNAITSLTIQYIIDGSRELSAHPPPPPPPPSPLHTHA